jgi:hypothetical protein
MKMRGKYTRDTNCWLEIRLLLELETELEKKVQGANPAKANSE